MRKVANNKITMSRIVEISKEFIESNTKQSYFKYLQVNYNIKLNVAYKAYSKLKDIDRDLYNAISSKSYKKIENKETDKTNNKLETLNNSQIKYKRSFEEDEKILDLKLKKRKAKVKKDKMDFAYFENKTISRNTLIDWFINNNGCNYYRNMTTGELIEKVEKYNTKVIDNYRKKIKR